jgi:glycosyltransferase involved in cell wall biosynthesis
MKVLVVMQSLGRGGGIVRSLLEMLPRIHGHGIESRVVVFGQTEISADDEYRAAGIPVDTIADDSLPARVRALRRVVIDQSIDVVHSSTFDAHLSARLAARFARVPEITSLVSRADPVVERRGLPIRRKMILAVDRWTARHLTDRFHAVSQFAADSWVQEVGIDPARVTVVERGRDSAHFRRGDDARRREVRTGLGLAPDAQIVLTVGRQAHSKRQTDLVDAFALLAAGHPKAVLLVAGAERAAHDDLLAHRAASGAADRIHLLGHRRDVPALLAAADLFAFPSDYEGFGGAAIEAMAAELPAVVADIPPMHELFVDGENGLIVDCRDHIAFAAALGRVLDDPELARSLAECAHAAFLARFTIERCAERMAELYRSVAAGETAVPIR